MNAQLNQLEDRVERWFGEAQRPAEHEIVVIANLIKEIVRNLKAIDERLERAEGTARKAANDASCLANGIQPD